MVVLHKVVMQARFLKRPFRPAFHEKTPVVAEHLRLHNPHAVQLGGKKVHRRFLLPQ